MDTNIHPSIPPRQGYTSGVALPNSINLKSLTAAADKALRGKTRFKAPLKMARGLKAPYFCEPVVAAAEWEVPLKVDLAVRSLKIMIRKTGRGLYEIRQIATGFQWIKLPNGRLPATLITAYPVVP